MEINFNTNHKPLATIKMPDGEFFRGRVVEAEMLTNDMVKIRIQNEKFMEDDFIYIVHGMNVAFSY